MLQTLCFNSYYKVIYCLFVRLLRSIYVYLLSQFCISVDLENSNTKIRNIRYYLCQTKLKSFASFLLLQINEFLLIFDRKVVIYIFIYCFIMHFYSQEAYL